MPKKPEEMGRRDFVRAVSGAAAIGGGLLAASDQSVADASTREESVPQAWRSSWRPDSPKRLSDTTHQLAERALSGEHGRAMANAGFALDEECLIGQSPDMRYAQACKLVAENAPLRILPGELIVGSATLLEAPAHRTPVAGVASTSHTTIGFDRVLRSGYQDLRKRIAERLARGEFEKDDSLGLAAGDGPDAERARTFRASPAGAYWAEALPRPEYDTPPFTVECWAKLASKDRYNVIVLNRNKESRRHWEIYSAAQTGRFSAYVPGCNPSVIESDRDITDGAWHYLAMTHAGSRVSLHVDGERVADVAVTPTDGLDAGSGPLYIGAYPPGGLGCDGLIGDIRLSCGSRAVDTMPRAPLSPDESTIGLWRVDDTGGDVVLADSSALGNPAVPIVNKRGADLLHAMDLCLDAAAVWHRHHMEALDRLAGQSTGEEQATYLRVREALRNVPERPPETFHEAVQSLWFMYAFQRLMGNWSGIGRIDEMLGPYLERDLAEDRITLDEAREILAHFWIKGCEWIGAFDTRGSGDAQHYQNIVLAGVDAEGKEVVNDVTYLVLDVVEELHISDFPIAVRINAHTPKKLLRRVAEVQRHGGGIVAVYNEKVVLDGLVRFGYSLEEARCFANDGCWEVLIPGKTTFSYVPFDTLSLLHETLGLRDPSQPPPAYEDFGSLYAAFVKRVSDHVDRHNRVADGWAVNGPPTPLISMFVDDCIERGRGYFDRGSHYTVLAPHAGGMPNAANSLLAIRKLVYEERSLTLAEFVQILRDDWKGQEPLRQLVLNRIEFYGNDDPESDAMLARLYNDYTESVDRVRERNGVLRPAGISTFGREIEWSRVPDAPRKASPDGHHAGDILATNFSPSPGTDRKGPTAVLKSYCNVDFTRVPNGATVELKLHPESVKDERGLDAMVALMRTFARLGGFFMHIDVVDSALLLDAQRHPEKYPNLSVRIAGWSARFATLDKNWQDMVIGRTQQYA